MASKRFLPGILVMVLVFGMTVVGCGNDSTDDRFTVTFDLDGGNINGNTAPVKIKVYPNSTIQTLPSPQKEGFIGSLWYTEKNGGGTQFTNNTQVTADLTVYRYWETEPAFIVNNIPSEYNGKYAVVYGTGTNNLGRPVSMRGGNNVGNFANWKFNAVKISSGSVRLPTWEIQSSGIAVRYIPTTTPHTITISFFIFNTEIVNSDNFDAAVVEAVKYVTFSSVEFNSERIVTKSWNDAH